MTELTIRYKFFHELIWPAAAGNIAWSFYSLLASHIHTPQNMFYERLAALGLLSFYLFYDWKRTAAYSDVSKNYLFFTVIHVSTIVFLALVIQSNSGPLFIPLSVVFGAAIVAHAFGAWDKPGQNQKRLATRSILVVVNVIGIVVVALTMTDYKDSTLWYLPVSLGVVLLLWWIARAKIISKMDLVKQEPRGGP